jgi:hypothetical protein
MADPQGSSFQQLIGARLHDHEAQASTGRIVDLVHLVHDLAWNIDRAEVRRGQLCPFGKGAQPYRPPGVSAPPAPARRRVEIH